MCRAFSRMQAPVQGFTAGASGGTKYTVGPRLSPNCVTSVGRVRRNSGSSFSHAGMPMPAVQIDISGWARIRWVRREPVVWKWVARGDFGCISMPRLPLLAGRRMVPVSDVLAEGRTRRTRVVVPPPMLPVAPIVEALGAETARTGRPLAGIAGFGVARSRVRCIAG